MHYYNTSGRDLVLPEYGRNIQNMVEHCMTIEDRAERTRCAYTIVGVMGNLFPNLRSAEDNNHKLWEHLAIMADFELDIDYPCQLVEKESLRVKPEMVPYRDIRNNRHRTYGLYVQQIINRCVELEDSDYRTALIRMVASQMHRVLQAAKESFDDKRILDDLRELSNGKIDLTPESFQIFEGGKSRESGSSQRRFKQAFNYSRRKQEKQ
ncbi:MAG: DUF4290 domain-containing protein [Bacteroidales bacterium]